MQIRTVLSGAIAFGLLASTSAQAALTLPNVSPTNSSMFVTVFDISNTESFTTDLNLFYNSFVNNTVVPGTILADAYTPLSFNLDMAIFADNNPNNIRFNVYAGDSSGGNTSKGLIITSVAPPALVTHTQMNSVNTAAAGVITSFNQNFATAGGKGTLGDETIWGSTINGNWVAGSGGSFNEEVAFYLVTGTGTNALGQARTTPFADAFGAWNWMLTETGTLTWSGQPAPIPLPAAVWLLISGLAGLGAIGRRSSQKA